MKRLRAILPLALASAVAAASCGDATPRAGGAAENGGITDVRTGDSLPELVPVDASGVLAEVARPGARGTLVNVWATWCAPCRQEFPDLMTVSRTWADSGLRLVLVSADFDDARDAARRFLADHGVRGRSLIKTGDDQAFIAALSPDWTGALPVTLAYDARGRLVDFHEGRADLDRLTTLARTAVGVAPIPIP